MRFVIQTYQSTTRHQHPIFGSILQQFHDDQRFSPYSCDVEKIRNLLKIALIHFPLRIDFQRVSQIFASITRENLQAREADVSTFFLDANRTKTLIALARCRSGQRVCCNKKLVLILSLVTDEEDHPLENEDESGIKLCFGEPFTKHVWKYRNITSTKMFCDMCNGLCVVICATGY